MGATLLGVGHRSLAPSPITMTKSIVARLTVAAVVCAIQGCATTEISAVADQPDLRFNGVVSAGQVRGERSAQVSGVVESELLRIFPKAQWLAGGAAVADVVLDISVYSARLTESRSTQEQRICRRWSEPDKDAKGTLQRVFSRKCLDWQTQQIPCLTRNYELDVQLRARQRASERILVSDRKVTTGSDRACGSDSPTLASLQADAESKAARWAVNLLRDPLAALASIPVQNAPMAPANLRTNEQVRAGVSEGRAQLPEPQATAPTGALRAHALVIGNGAYPGSARLDNPVNDARAMSEKLRSMGFSVTTVTDARRGQMLEALGQFQRSASGADVSLLYFAGHGVQIDGANFILPTDIDHSDVSKAIFDGVRLSDAIDNFLPGKTKLVLLDACRDNPLQRAGSRSLTRGLAPMNVSQGTLIAYATRDGQVALDGVGQKHSPFTQALLEHLGDPTDIGVVLRRVREKVMQATGGKQQPWDYGSLTGGELVLSSVKGGK